MRSRTGSARRSGAARRNAVDNGLSGMGGLQARMLEYSIGASVNAPLETAVVPYVLSGTKDGVATLILNRGERFNPLSRAMIAALQSEVDRIAGDASVRSVVIAAEGRGFCAGHDLKELRAQRSDALAHAPAATGDREGARHRDGRGLPACFDVRSRRGRRERKVCAAR